MLEISNNSTSIMRSCQKKYHWTYIAGLKPIRKTTSLSLGTVLHSAFDMYYKGFQATEVYKYIIDTMDEQLSKVSPEETEDVTIAKYILIGMWNNYPFNLDGFKKIEAEKEFRVNVPGISDVVFVGKVDGLVTDHQNKLWVRELKSTSQTFEQFEVRARRAQQASGYIWAMRKLGYPVEGIIYDYVKKPLLRKGKAEDMHQYGYRILTDYSTRRDMYYKRHYVYRTQEELDMFEDDLRSCATDILARSQDGCWHRNSDQCWNYNTECPYLKICYQKIPDPLTVQLYFETKQTPNKGGVDVGRTN